MGAPKAARPTTAAAVREPRGNDNDLAGCQIGLVATSKKLCWQASISAGIFSSGRCHAATGNTSPLTISVSPWLKHPGSFIATFDGRELCRSRRPFLSAARTFRRDGFHELTRLDLIHAGSATIALTSTIGAAAGLDVNEDGPRFCRYRPPPDARRGRGGLRSIRLDPTPPEQEGQEQALAR